MQSIKPLYCELIAAGKKTIEVRKTRPKIQTPFKSYIYETKFINRCRDCEYYSFENIVIGRMKDVCKWEKDNWKITSLSSRCFQNKYSGGKVIGEYVCDRIIGFGFSPYPNHGEYASDYGRYNNNDILKASCLSFEEMYDYIGEGSGYLWHITNLKIYDEPKELSKFYIRCKKYDLDEKEVYEAYCTDCGNKYGIAPCEFIKSNWCIPLTRPPQSWCYVEAI